MALETKALSPQDRLIVALDVSSATEAFALVDRLGGSCRWFKVGMELFYTAGHPLVERLRESGFEVFLDLKLHDIPNTVAGAVRSVAATGASLLTLHASGGAAMISAAVEQAASLPGAPRLLAVTVLTSMDAEQLAGTGISSPPAEQVERLARLAWQTGVRGMVCSAAEVAHLRAILGPEAELVVPGIRPEGSEAGDQRRIATPEAAIRSGASRLVIGRPITQAANPELAARTVLEQIEAAG